MMNADRVIRWSTALAWSALLWLRRWCHMSTRVLWCGNTATVRSPGLPNDLGNDAWEASDALLKSTDRLHQ